MKTTNDELNTFVQREQIRDCLARIARGEDRRDPELISTCYWPDASVDFGIFSGDFPKYLAWVTPGSPAVPVTQHILGQSVIVLDGQLARAETHVQSYHRIDMGSEHRDMTIGGRYLDRFEKRAGEWRVLQRTMLYDWLQDYGQSVSWTHGVMGTPFSASHFTGRATGDFSETFFSEKAQR